MFHPIKEETSARADTEKPYYFCCVLLKALRKDKCTFPVSVPSWPSPTEILRIRFEHHTCPASLPHRLWVGCRVPEWASATAMVNDGVETCPAGVHNHACHRSEWTFHAKEPLLFCFMSVKFQKVYCFVMLFCNKALKTNKNRSHAISDLNPCNVGGVKG